MMFEREVLHKTIPRIFEKIINNYKHVKLSKSDSIYFKFDNKNKIWVESYDNEVHLIPDIYEIIVLEIKLFEDELKEKMMSFITPEEREKVGVIPLSSFATSVVL